MDSFYLERASSPETVPSPPPTVILKLSNPPAARIVSEFTLTAKSDNKEEAEIKKVKLLCNPVDPVAFLGCELPKSPSPAPDLVKKPKSKSPKKKRGEEDEDYFNENHMLIRRSLSSTLQVRSKPIKILVPEFANVDDTTRISNDEIDVGQFNRTETHQILEKLEARILNGDDKQHIHPGLVVAAKKKLTETEKTRIVAEMATVSGYSSTTDIKRVKPAFWAPRVWDDEMTELSADESESLRKKMRQAPSPFVRFVPVISQSPSLPAPPIVGHKQRVQKPKKMVKSTICLPVRAFDTESSSDDSDYF